MLISWISASGLNGAYSIVLATNTLNNRGCFLTSTMASRGSLPGFLRRSVRADYSEDDDDFDGDELSGSSSSSSSASGFPRTSKNGNESNDNDKVTSERGEMPSPPTAQEVAQPSHESQSISVSSRTSMPPPPNLQTTSSHSSRRSSEPLSMNSSQNQPGEPSERGPCDDSQPKRKKTYRQSQFEKTFSANVVSMNDLRTLAWNGIPVSFECSGLPDWLVKIV